MATMTATGGRDVGMTSEQRMVIFASSLGTVFEWYDFYIYGTLGAYLAKYFFSNVPANVGFIFALLTFAAGFAVRPFGALIFGRLGDTIGRKYTFLITMSLMGVGTFFIGVLPGLHLGHRGADRADRTSPGARLGTRRRIWRRGDLRRRTCAPGKRGFYTSWIQTTATLGLFMALLLILGIRTAMGDTAFGDWGWRIPFLLSAILLGVSIWIRLKLNELPLFKKMVDEGTRSKAPLKEAFGQWSNAKIAIAALFGATAGEAVVWYGGQFYALFFLTQTLKVPAVTRMDHDRGITGTRHRRVHPVRLAVGQDRPQADHDGGFRARRDHLLPDLRRHHALRQSETGSGSRRRTDRGHRRSGGMLVPVQGDGHREVHHRLR